MKRPKFVTLICGGVACISSPLVAQAPAAISTVIPVPPTGHGEVVFFRKGSLMGMANSCRVTEGDKDVSSLSRGDYYVAVADPGEHTYSVGSSGKDGLRLEVEPDEVQYVECFMKMKLAGWQPTLAPSTYESFESNFNGQKK